MQVIGIMLKKIHDDVENGKSMYQCFKIFKCKMLRYKMYKYFIYNYILSDGLIKGIKNNL